ncbi:MAG: hypothetical protein II512_02230 [Lachnospira sp.]|nr:hypothetical protein [Lachnospira sp.]
MNRKNLVNYILAVLVITFMVFLSELLGEKEIIFPELAALSVGSLVLAALPWVVDGKRMILYISLSAVCGVLIVLFLPGPLYFQMIVAYALSQVIFLLSRTTMAPMISAIVLPVMLQTRGYVYILAAISLTSLIVFIRWIVVKKGLKLNVVYKPADSLNKDNIVLALERIIVVSLLMLIFIPKDLKFMLAPPLLVAFTEFTRKGNKALKAPVKAVLLITLCATTGMVFRFILTVKAGLPLTLVAALVASVTFLIMIFMKMYLPPAAAMGVLALLIPEEKLLVYPLQVVVGITCLMLFAKLIDKFRYLFRKK